MGRPGGSMDASDVRTVGVIGCGVMGSGIVEVCAKAGLDVVVIEIDDEHMATGRQRIETSMARAVERGKLEGSERDAALARITDARTLDELAGVDLAIEAATESLETKLGIFR